MLAGFGLLWLLRQLVPRPASRVLTSGLLLFSVALILRGSLYDPPNLRQLRDQPEERASLALQANLPKGSLVASGAPGAAWAAHMTHYPSTGENLLVDTPDALYSVLLADGVQAIYIDHYLSGNNRDLWELIEPGIGQYYEQIYSDRSGSIRVLLVKH
ncbi:MAG: hypothetical protein ACRDFQ_00430 [Anaerolineales bacterium]